MRIGHRSRSLLAGLFIGWVFAGWMFAADSLGDDPYPWKVGFASANITPTEPLRMAGYASQSREQPFEGIASELFAKAMAIEDAEGTRALVITTDLIGFTAAVSEPIYQRITQTTGLSREQILINSSHTHCGPTLGTDEEKLSHLGNPEHVAATLRYSSGLTDTLVKISANALDRLEPADISWSVGVATFVMNRREFTDRGVRLGVNPRGHVDRSVPVLKIKSAEGDLRGVLFGAACHNTTLGGKSMQISGDYAGYAQQYIQKELGISHAMFMQGCGGDANPYPRDSEEIARIHGMTLGEEVVRVLASDAKPVEGPLRTVLQSVNLPLQTQISQATFDKLELASGSTRGVAKNLRAKLESDGKLAREYQTHISCWQFGKDLTMVGLPGEVVVDYVRLIEDAIGPRQLWISAYNHDVFGYLPSARVMREGGYEMRGIYSGVVGIFDPRAENAVVKTVQTIAKRSGRTMPGE